MRPTNENIVHKNKGSRALNVVMHAVPVASVGCLTAANMIGGKPLDEKMLAMMGLMFGGVALPPIGTFAEHRGKLSERGKQVVLTVSNASMLSAVALMALGVIPVVKQSDDAKIALSGMVLFALSSILNIPYHAARSCNVIGSKLALELTSTVAAFVGSWLFLAAQVLAYVQAKQQNNETAMHSAILLGIASLGFVSSTGYGAAQIAKAMRNNGVVDSVSRATLEEAGNAPVSSISRYALLPHEFPRVAPSTTAVAVDNDLAQPLIQSPSSPN